MIDFNSTPSHLHTRSPKNYIQEVLQHVANRVSAETEHICQIPSLYHISCCILLEDTLLTFTDCILENSGLLLSFLRIEPSGRCYQWIAIDRSGMMVRSCRFCPTAWGESIEVTCQQIVCSRHWIASRSNNMGPFLVLVPVLQTICWHVDYWFSTSSQAEMTRSYHHTWTVIVLLWQEIYCKRQMYFWTHEQHRIFNTGCKPRKKFLHTNTTFQKKILET